MTFEHAGFQLAWDICWRVCTDWTVGSCSFSCLKKAEGLCTLEVLRGPVTLHLVLGSTRRRVHCSTTKDRNCACAVWSMPKVDFSAAIAKFKISQAAKSDEA